MISVAPDRDPRWTWFKPISHRESDSKSRQCAGWVMKYEHPWRERVLHNDKTEITPNPKIPESSVTQHGTGVANQHRRRVQLDLPSTNPMTMLTWTCKSADSTVELLGACSACELIAVTYSSRQMLARKR